MKTFINWSRQPTTITGVAALAGTISALLTSQLTAANAVPLLVGSLLSIALPDNGGARVAVEHLVADAVQAEQLIVQSQGDLTVSSTPGAPAA